MKKLIDDEMLEAKEFFTRLRIEKIDAFIKSLEELKQDHLMATFRNDRDFYKKWIDEVFDLFDKEQDYITFSKVIEHYRESK